MSAKPIELIKEVLDACYDNTESFEADGIGASLAYLVMAVIGGYPMGVTVGSSFETLLHETFETDHPVWRYIEPYEG